MILKVLLLILLTWFAYKFVFNFILPVWKVSRRMRNQMKEFQKMAQQQQQPPQPEQTTNTNKNNTSSKPKAGEYIDFEEVKGR